LRLYAAAARERDEAASDQERDEAASDQERDEADRKAKALSKVASAVLAMEPCD
jgi:hypothetical protein